MSERDHQSGELKALYQGDFAEAYRLYGDLLERRPDSVEAQVGFYAAGYWRNRLEQEQLPRSGRALAAYLMEHWEAFEVIADERGYPGTEAFAAAMKAVLGLAAENLRHAFQEEGTSGVDLELLKQLGICLVRTEDYQNAAEVLNYARKKNDSDAFLMFLLAECYCHLGAGYLDRGLSLYRDTCFTDHQAIDPVYITSEPAAPLLERLYREHDNNVQAALDWFGAWMQLRSLRATLRQLHPREIEYLNSEIRRLTRDLDTVIDKYKDRVRARLCFYHLALFHYYRYQEISREEARNHEAALEALSPELYAALKEGPGNKR
ncbi:MAG: hypothetical protein H7A21_20395 [Spirochaetales bacterium]|nr:hypothetical protein [Leptospiraceae bacterium]MCP5483811.1 hypothetical protein [Spirochaetales bacterium]